MKPSVIRNKSIYQATNVVKSKLLCSHLSKDLQNKYNKRSIRVTEGDTVKVMRGEYAGVSGKITKVSTEKNGAAIEGIKKEKLKGGNIDIFVHASNLLVTDLNTEDKWRQSKLEGKSTKLQKEVKPKETPPQKEEKKKVKQEQPKETEKPQETQEKPKETKQKVTKTKTNKESKITKKTKKEDTK